MRLALLIAFAALALAGCQSTPTPPASDTSPTRLLLGDKTKGWFGVETNGTSNIFSVYPTKWAPEEPLRLRMTTVSGYDTNSYKQFLITPYQYGMLMEYDGQLEIPCMWLSIHAKPYQSRMPGQLYVGDQMDSGGLYARGWSLEDLWAEVASETFGGYSHGDLRLRVVRPEDSIGFWWGKKDETQQEMSRIAREGGYFPMVEVQELHIGTNVVTVMGGKLLLNGKEIGQ